MLAVGTFSGAVFASKFTSLPPPIQGAKALQLVLAADTVTGPSGGADESRTCAQSNYFHAGQTVVFRMWANDVKNGGYPITNLTVVKGYPVVTIPSSPTPILLPMSYVQEPYGAPPSKQTSYFEAHWMVPTGYPLGVINFTITAKTLKTKKYPVLTGTYTQKGFSSNSQLQITA